MAAIIVLLVIWVCISTSDASNIRREYSHSRSVVAESLYGSLYMMALEYDDASLAGADVEGSIIPAMKEYFIRAQTQNTVLTSAFPGTSPVLDDALTQELSQAFAAYDSAFSSGSYTNTATELMTQAIIHVRETLQARYDTDARLTDN